MIPRFKPWLDRKELFALFKPNSGAVRRFEKQFAREFGANDAVAFPYGRSALWAFLQAVGVKEAEVILPAYTCSVVAHGITLSGNTPRFVDINLTDYNMDLEKFADAINDKTRAVVATHLFGYPLDIDRVESIVAEAESRYGHKIWLIQDCAHSFGATWKGRLVGTSGDAGLYALNISKMMTSIFGGMLTFQDPELADKVRTWRDKHFKRPGKLKAIWRRLYLLAVYLAFNNRVYGLTWWLQQKTPLLNRLTKSYHLDDKVHFPPDYADLMLDVEAMVGMEQLRKYPDIISRRRETAAWYHNNLPRIKNWKFPPLVEGATYSHYVIRVPDRNEVIEEFASKGIQLGELIQYSVPELNSYTNGYSYSASSHASQTTINIPVSAVTAEQQNLVKVALEEDNTN